MKTKPLLLALTSAVVFFCGPAAPPLSAQYVVSPAIYYQPLSPQQLDQLLGPIALYPDPLLAQILAAATLPTQIEWATRYVTSGGDPSRIDRQPWDASVQAVAHYPSVLKYLNDNLDWTTQVGQALLYQPQAVMDAIQRLRQSARNFGNLYSTPQQQVVDDNGYIEILPVDAGIIYVPVYQPDYVYFRSGHAWRFGAAFSLGPWLNGNFDWHQHHLNFWDRPHRHHDGDRPVYHNLAWPERPEHHDEVRPDVHRELAYNERHEDREVTHSEPNLAVINVAHHDAGPRPAATPKPVAEPRAPGGHTSGAFQPATHPAPASPAPGHAMVDGHVPASSDHDHGQERPPSTPHHAEPAANHPAPETGHHDNAHSGSQPDHGSTADSGSHGRH